MEIQGKVTNILPMRSGVSARGEWKSQEFVITTEEQYPKMVCFQVFGEDKINSFALQIGEVVKVSYCNHSLFLNIFLSDFIFIWVQRYEKLFVYQCFIGKSY